jgi:hypothetical protein
VALVLAIVTAGPTLVELATSLPATLKGIVAMVPFVISAGHSLARTAPGSAALLFKVASAVVLAVVGLQVARASQRARSLSGGV